MVKYIECPACHKRAVRVDISSENYQAVTSGRPLSEFPCMSRCQNCFRRIKYAVEKVEKK